MIFWRPYGFCLLDRDGKSDNTWLACTGSLNLASDTISYKGNNLWNNTNKITDGSRDVRACTVLLGNKTLVLLPISGTCNHVCVHGTLPKVCFV